MRRHATNEHENRGPSAATRAVAQRQGGRESDFRFADSRREANVQRTIQEMADLSPQARQLRATQDLINQSASAMKPKAPQHPIRGVVQMAFDTQVKAGVLNVIGENHQKDEKRRRQEKELAHENGLTYLGENEFGIIKDEKVTIGDPSNLRILFAMASIKENIAELVEKKKNASKKGGMVDPTPNLTAIQWALNNVGNNILGSNSTSENGEGEVECEQSWQRENGGEKYSELSEALFWAF